MITHNYYIYVFGNKRLAFDVFSRAEKEKIGGVYVQRTKVGYNTSANEIVMILFHLVLLDVRMEPFRYQPFCPPVKLVWTNKIRLPDSACLKLDTIA